MMRTGVMLGALLIVIASAAVVGGTNVVSIDGDTAPGFVELSSGTDPFDPDSDSDGLRDGAESDHGTNPMLADTDGDGLSDGREIEVETDPTQSDTDGDGVPDGSEVNEHGTDPTVGDTDGDGLDDGVEVNRYGSNPTSLDTDDDGLADPIEVDTHGTDPAAADTDGDGLDDIDELETHGTDPTVADMDGDGVDDGREIGGPTDPTKADTDGDGLGDRRELDGETDPTKPDTDGDGLEDGPEVKEHETDPTSSDTDGDGLDDRTEVERIGSDPTVIDSDGDSLDDASEVRTHGTDPTAADTDEDGLLDPDELTMKTDPTDADTDDDGVGDGGEDPDDDGLVNTVEVNDHGTDPENVDTDGDRLEDGWEVANQTDSGVALPGADPNAMDLFVQFNYSQDAERVSESFIADLRDQWSLMPVENPDGTTGITLHVVNGGPVSEQVLYTGDNYGAIRAEYRESNLGDRVGVYYNAMFVFFTTDTQLDGKADIPGDFSLIAARSDPRSQRNIVVHELLHNVLGELEVESACADDPVHLCRDGWLRSQIRPFQDEFLPESVAAEIEENGFEEDGPATE